MRVLVIANRSFVIARSRGQIIKGLIEKGFEVVIVTEFDGTESSLGEMGCRLESVNLASHGIGLLEIAGVSARLLGVMKKHDPSVVLCFNLKSVILGAVLARFWYGNEVSVIGNVTGMGYAHLLRGPIRLLGDAVSGLVLSFLDLVVFQNKRDEAYCLKSSGLSRRRSRVLVGSGINTLRFQPGSGVEECQSRLKVLFVGRLLWSKGLREFVEMAEQSRAADLPLEFTICGEFVSGHPDAVDESFVRGLEGVDNIHYVGFVNEIERVYRESDVLVFPSIYPEGVPRAVLEACACGLVSIVYRASWTEGVVDDVPAVIVMEQGDVDGMIDQLESLSEDRETLCRLASTGPYWVARHFEEGMVSEKYLEVCAPYLRTGKQFRVRQAQ